ncbi:hypothetical protein AVEN_152272-1 [Araneus ventricosus]|uniref:Uncharacterized protein n=1 Tax=Araneus ventricosus TaxID=182803 RepID=A0A4Y2LYY7_ARAVE|nr:hypothetical protein AVEN_152272-1 [Araneus ventricosus]
MGIFLVIIQSGGCDSSFRERSIRDISRRLMKFDSSNRINRYRTLDKKKILLGNSLAFELDTDASTSDSESGRIIPLKLARETFQTPKFSDKKDRSRRISMKERSTSKSVIEFLPDMSNGIHILKVLALNDDTSLKAVEPTRIRNDITMQRRFSNERKNRLSEDRRINRFRENIRSRRLNIRLENNNEERMSNMHFRDTEIRKTFRLVKWEISDFSTPSESSEIGLFHRQTRLVIPKRVSFKGRFRNVRQEVNDIERFVRKDRSNTRNLPNLKLSEISMERNTGSKLQQPRYERHLLVPKRELKIPSDEVTVRADNSRRSRKSIRTNDINHGNVEETTDERINGRGLQRTLDKRMDFSRRQSIEAVVRHRQNRMALLESGRIRNQIETRKSAHSSSIESSGRIQNRQRTDVLSFSRRNREVSSRTITASSQTRENNKQMQTRGNARDLRVEFSERIQHRQRTDVLGSNRRDREVSTRTIITAFQNLENNNSNRKLRTNELHSNRHKDKRLSRRSANVFVDERIRFNRERKLSSENRQLMMKASSKENISDDLRIRIRSIRNRDRATDTLTNGMRRGIENQRERKQQNVRSDERFSTQFRSQINNERSILTVHNKLHEARSRNRDLRIRNKRIGRVTNMETRRSIMRLKTPLNERFFKSSGEIRTSANREIVIVRSIITSPSRLKGNIQMERSDDKEIISLDINIRNANRRTATNQRSEQRAENIRLSTENDRRIRKDLVMHRIVDSRNRRSEPRINVGRILRNHRFRDELKQSKLRVSSHLTEESSVRTTTQMRKERSSRESEQQKRRISVRSVPKHLISTPKLHSTATNFTFKDNVRGFSVSKFREIVSSELPTVSSDRTTKLYRSITARKSSSSNKSFMDYYEYLSEKRSSFISLILNVMLGLAVIVASSDDKNKGFIPRRLTPFVDGFLKYTTVL